MEIKIRGTRQNDLALFIDGYNVGSVDNDHEIITIYENLPYTSEQIVDAVNEWYAEESLNYDCYTNYKVNYDIEESEDEEECE